MSARTVLFKTSYSTSGRESVSISDFEADSWSAQPDQETGCRIGDNVNKLYLDYLTVGVMTAGVPSLGRNRFATYFLMEKPSSYRACSQKSQQHRELDATATTTAKDCPKEKNDVQQCHSWRSCNSSSLYSLVLARTYFKTDKRSTAAMPFIYTMPMILDEGWNQEG